MAVITYPRSKLSYSVLVKGAGHGRKEVQFNNITVKRDAIFYLQISMTITGIHLRQCSKLKWSDIDSLIYVPTHWKWKWKCRLTRHYSCMPMYDGDYCTHYQVSRGFSSNSNIHGQVKANHTLFLYNTWDKSNFYQSILNIIPLKFGKLF